MTARLLDIWYGGRHGWFAVLLLPLAGLFRLIITLRRFYLLRLKPSPSLSVPVIVVGNINLGGSGKSPLLIALVQHLRELGYRPGVVSRGYGSRAPSYPYLVNSGSSPEEAGDEPLMIARRGGCPVMIGADRLAAARKLIADGHCDVILSDDGLQHYRLPRDLEIVVMDGQRRFGNGRLLPAGPLREPLSRLRQVDWILVNGGSAEGLAQFSPGKKPYPMELQVSAWHNLLSGRRESVDSFPWQEESRAKESGTAERRVHALAGIGNPERFFQTLRQLGLDVIPHSFPDHHQFRMADLQFNDDLPVVMTEKDAMKCEALLQGAVEASAEKKYWYLAVQTQVDDAFYESVAAELRSLSPNSASPQASSSASAGK